jgi:sugar/nucleoside kinase (ribokinase family)
MKKGLFVGLTVVDIQYFVERFPNSNEKIKTEPPQILVGGPAANAASTCQFLGTQASLVTSVGQNHFASFVAADFENQGVQLYDQSRTVSTEPVFATVVTSIGNGDRAIISHMPPTVALTSGFLSEIQLSEFDFVLTDGFYPEMALLILTQAKLLGIPVIFDGGSWKPYLYQLLPLVDYAICSANFSLPHTTNKLELIDALHALGINYIAISQGHDSILASENGNLFEVEVPQVETCDTLGAGDILHGAFAHFLTHNTSFKERLALAAQVASFSCKFRGTRTWYNFFERS